VLGSNSSDDNRANTVSVGASAVPGMGTSLLRRQIINVAAGTQDTDAVNVSQLKGVTTALGGGAAVNADGTVKKPSYNVAGGTYGDVGAALSAVDAKAASGSVDGVKYDTSAHDSVTFSGTNGTALSNVKAGAVSSASMDAINGSQLYTLAASNAAALGGGATVNPDGSITKPQYSVGGNTVNGVDGAVGALDGRITDMSSALTDIGPKLKYIKFGETNALDATAGGLDAVAIGGFAQALGDGALAIGANSRAMALNSVAVGAGSSTTQANTFAVGSSTSKRRIVNVADATNLSDAVTLGQMTTAIGTALVTGGLKNGSMAATSLQTVSAAAQPDLADAVGYDTATHDKVTLGGVGGTSLVTLTNLQDANLSATSTDAVTGAQLYAANQQIASLDQSVQNFAANGSVHVAANTSSGPAAATGSGSFAAGGGAQASGNNSTALGDRAQATASGSTALGAQSNAAANNSVALGANSVASRDNSVSVGALGAERQIVNVAAGVEGNDAVNVNQLNAAVANTNQQMSGMQSQINSVAKGANAGTAAAMAVAGLPQPTQPGKAMVAIAGAQYGGQTGTAFGASYVTQNNKFVVKLSGNTSTNGNVGVVAGAGFQW
ncbi:MAG TPA: YadA-like family protein, partial [Paraburkholderia sp.]